MAICDACRKEPLRRRFRLVDQLKGAASSSVMANIAEGFDRGSPDEFHKSFCIAKGEASEIMSHLAAARDDQMIAEVEFEALSSLALRVATEAQEAIVKERSTQHAERPPFYAGGSANVTSTCTTICGSILSAPKNFVSPPIR